MNFVEAVSTVFKKYFDFKSRSGRAEFWYYTLFIFIFTIITMLVDIFILNIPAEAAGPVNVIFSLITLIPSISVTARRLHDIGKSGWWQLIMLTIIGIIPLIYWCCKKGDESRNKYGFNPYDARS
jgi:uncharacterized membrane protein YhaH (DUF805 family)